MSIQVKVKQVYGKETIYPICNKAILFAKMVGQKTLTRDNLKVIKDLGYTIEQVSEQVTL